MYAYSVKNMLLYYFTEIRNIIYVQTFLVLRANSLEKLTTKSS